jgi:very-short-patch-repair endonuclease
VTTIGRTNRHAARLRAASTDAEQRLWYDLRNRQLGGFKFRRQVTVGRFIADFACFECQLIVEADGGQHGAEQDAARSAYLGTLGWKVLRFWNNDILHETNAVLERILSHYQEREEGRPLPCPLPLAGEGN